MDILEKYEMILKEKDIKFTYKETKGIFPYHLTMTFPTGEVIGLKGRRSKGVFYIHLIESEDYRYLSADEQRNLKLILNFFEELAINKKCHTIFVYSEKFWDYLEQEILYDFFSKKYFMFLAKQETRGISDLNCGITSGYIKDLDKSPILFYLEIINKVKEILKEKHGKGSFVYVHSTGKHNLFSYVKSRGELEIELKNGIVSFKDKFLKIDITVPYGMVEVKLDEFFMTFKNKTRLRSLVKGKGIL